MGIELQAVSALCASCAFIILVICSLQNIKAWGQVHGLSDLPAGALLGLTSMAQMFHPIEPFEGFIFDLRNAPVALLGAFCGWRATLLGAGIAALARFGIGGTGMTTGIMAIFYAAGMGALWQYLRNRGILRGMLAYPALGALTTSSLLIGLTLPEPVRGWFLANAVPVLAAAYMTILPLIAWIGDRGFLFDSVTRQTARAAMGRKEFDLLSLPGLIHQIRQDAIQGHGQQASAVLCLQIKSLYHLDGRHSRTSPHGIQDAIVLRISEALPDIRKAGLLDARTLLFPLTRDQLKQLDRIRDGMRDCLHQAPFNLSQTSKHWLAYDLGLIGVDAFQDGGHLVPRRIANCRRLDTQTALARTTRRKPDTPRKKDDRFDRLGTADILFLKARLLMDKAA